MSFSGAFTIKRMQRRESEGVADEASKPSVRRGHLSANLMDDLHQQQWSVPGRGKNKAIDSKLGMSFGF